MTWSRDQAEYLAKLDRLEVQYRRKVANERNRFIRSVSERLSNGGENFDLLAIQHRHVVQEMAIDQVRRVVPVFGKRAASLVPRKAVTDSPDFFERMIDQWIVQHTLEAATGIATTDASEISAAIRSGISEGINPREVAQKILKLRAMTPWRAEAIARTETASAASFADSETVKQASKDFGLIMIKKWLPTQDERTRASHSEMSNHPWISLDDKFNVGGVKMDRPLDPAGNAANIINCRCTLIRKVQEFDIE